MSNGELNESTGANSLSDMYLVTSPKLLEEIELKWHNYCFNVTMIKTLRFVILCLMFLKGNSQSCFNFDFESFSSISSVPNIVTITTTNTIPGWTVSSGTFSGTINACNLSTCCPSSPTSPVAVGTSSSTGYIDPAIGPSYPLFSIYGNTNTPNANPAFQGFGNWFIRLNDSTPNNDVHVLYNIFAVTPANCIFNYAILPVFKKSYHPNCYQPTLKIRVWKMIGCTGVLTSLNPDILLNSYTLTLGPSCPSYTPNFITCPQNSSFSYMPWQRGMIDLSTFIGDCVKFEILVSDCSLGDHSGYVYFDAECRASNSYNLICGLPCPYLNTYSSCGSTNIPVYAPTGLSSYSWAGPSGWPGNGANTSSVNLTLPGTYTVSYSGFGMCTAITRTLTLNITPAASSSLTVAQNTACVGGANIVLNGQPPGGIYSGTYVIGNNFSPLTAGIFTVQYKYTDSNLCSDSTTKSISVFNCTTGIPTYASQSIHFEIFPSPANEEIIIRTDLNKLNYLLSIQNIIGQEVINIDFTGDTQRINISNLSKGIYFLRLKSNHDILLTRKLIKD